MPRNRYVILGGIFALLLLANIAYYLYEGWGLITVNVTDAPLSQVIRSIEWQGWVKIYSNVPIDSKVTMYVDHVPLAEAMESLASNITLPPRNPPADGSGPNGGTPPSAPGAPGTPDAGAPVATAPGGPDGAPPPGGVAVPGGVPPSPDGNQVAAAGAPPGGADNGGGPGGDINGPGSGRFGGGGRRGGGGGGGNFGAFGGGVQWNLGFFVAPTSAAVKDEINTFVAGTPDENIRVYTYPTPVVQLVSGSDQDIAAPDPRVQSWPGVRPPAPKPPAPASAPDATAATTGDATITPVADTSATAAPAADAPPNVQTYLQAFAESSNIWIMSPSTWTTNAPTPPPANPSIISAVRNFISSMNGSVTQAIILRVGRGGPRVRPGAGAPDFASNNPGGYIPGTMDDATADRLRNAINGLPEEARSDALSQVDQEVKFRQDVQAAPVDQQQKMVQDHMTQRMAKGAGGGGRQSPEKRATMFKRMVNNREQAQGKK